MKYVNTIVQDSGLSIIKTTAATIKLVSAWTIGQNTVAGLTGVLASIAVATGDFTLAGADNATRTLTLAAKPGATATATGGGSTGGSGDTGNCLVVCDATNVLWVTDESSKQAVTTGNTVNFPSIVLSSVQPV